MRYIDKMLDGMTALESATWFFHVPAQDGFRVGARDCRTLWPDFTPVNADACVQETLTHRKWRLESRRKLMFPHFFIRTNGSLRTSLPKRSSQSTFCDGLWITHVGSGASA